VKAPRADSDCTPAARAKHDTFWIRSVDFAPLENFATKLPLLTRTPRIDPASDSQYNQMVVSSGNVDASLVGKSGFGDELVRQAS
jgi:hypothetical protein